MKISKRLYLNAANLLLILVLVAGCSMFQKRQTDPVPPPAQLSQPSVSEVMPMPIADPNLAQPQIPTVPPVPTTTQPPVTPEAVIPPQLMVVNPNARYKIGLLVPLTGSGATIGKQLTDSAQMALLDSGTKDFQILAFDTAGQGGASGAADLALNQHVSVILGPVFSNDVIPVAAKAKAANIRVFSFSNNKNVANGNVYILGLVPEQQVNRILKYAGSHGIKGFSAFLPANAFGTQLTATIKRLAGAAGGGLVKSSTYSADYDAAARELSEAFGRKSITLDKRSQALLVPEGGEHLPQILTSLGKVGLTSNSIQIIGTSFWDREEIITSPLTEGAWYVSTPYEGQDAFDTRFNMSYKYKPDDIAALGYDATNLAMEAVNGNYSDADLKRSAGFKGVKGIYKFGRDNVDVRGYAIYQITGGGAHVVDPAPDRF